MSEADKAIYTQRQAGDIEGRPIVSVILMGYNQAQYFDKAVQSVLSQTFSNLELILIDNGSTDNTRDILEKYLREPRVRLIAYKDNGFINQRLNLAIKSARGDFISFLCADDYYLPEKLAVQVAAFEKLSREFGVVYSPSIRHNLHTGIQWVEPSAKASGSILKTYLLDFDANGSIPWITPLFRKSCLDAHPFYEDLTAEGEFIHARIALTHKHLFLPDPLCVMTEHYSNTGKAITINRTLITALLARLAAEPSLPSEGFRWIKTFEARMHRNYGWQAVRMSANPSWALDCFRSAIRANFAQILHPRLLLGFILLLSPAPLRALINKAITSITAPKNNLLFKSDYSI